MKLTLEEIEELARLANLPSETAEESLRLDELVAKRRAPEPGQEIAKVEFHPSDGPDTASTLAQAIVVLAEFVHMPPHHPALLTVRKLC